MSHISIGSAVGAGFGLIGRRPLTVLTWGLVRILVGVGILAIYAPVMLSVMAPMMQAAASGASPDTMSQAVMGQMMALQGMGFLVQIISLLVAVVVYCAVARSIIHPERGSFGYLRLSAVELLLTVLFFAAGFVIAIVIIICAIPFAIGITVLALNKMAVAGVIVGVLGGVVLLVAMIYVLLRFAFLIPMMVDDGRFHLFDAWSRTKGHVAALFAIGLCLAVIGIVGEILVGAVFVAIGAAALGVSAGGLQNLQAFFSLPPTTVLTRLAPWLAVIALLAIPLEGCVIAIFMAPWARAYRDATPPLAAVFEETPPAPPPRPIEPTPTPA